MRDLFPLSAICFALFLTASIYQCQRAVAQDASPEKSGSAEVEQGIPGVALLDYQRDIKPIIDKKCLQCHGDDVTEGDLNFDEIETLDEFIKAGSAADSDFYQRLITDDEDELMPPPWDVEDEVVEALTPSDILLIREWIDQGAKLEVVTVEKHEAEPEHIAMRIWRFFGSFHPALTHFPVALFTIAAVFVVLFYRNPAISNEAAYYCLIFGTLGAIAASVLGWALAYEKSSADILDMESEMFWHRWSGIVVAVVALIVTWIGWKQRGEEYADGGGSWKFGVVVLAAIVGLVGFQGGELVYGEGHYLKQLNRYWPEAAEKIFPEENKVDGEADKSGESTVADESDGEQPDDKQPDGKQPDGKQPDEQKSETDNSESKTAGGEDGTPVEKSDSPSPGQDSTVEKEDAPIGEPSPVESNDAETKSDGDAATEDSSATDTDSPE